MGGYGGKPRFPSVRRAAKPEPKASAAQLPAFALLRPLVLALLAVRAPPVGTAVRLLMALVLVPLALVALALVRLAFTAHALRDDIAVADGEQDLDLVELVPFGVGALPFGDREELLEARAGGVGLLRSVHAPIIARSIRQGRADALPW